MSNDNLQMHQINSTSSIGDSTLTHNPSCVSMAPKSATVQFASDSPITDPGQSTKVSCREIYFYDIFIKLESSIHR